MHHLCWEKLVLLLINTRVAARVHCGRGPLFATRVKDLHIGVSQSYCSNVTRSTYKMYSLQTGWTDGTDGRTGQMDRPKGTGAQHERLHARQHGRRTGNVAGHPRVTRKHITREHGSCSRVMCSHLWQYRGLKLHHSLFAFQRAILKLDCCRSNRNNLIITYF